MTRSFSIAPWLAALVSLMQVSLAAGCMLSAEAPARQASELEEQREGPAEEGWAAGGGASADAPARAPAEPVGGLFGGDDGSLARGRAEDRSGNRAGEGDERDKKEDAGGPSGAGAPAAPTRAWFPESFLWRPLVLIPAGGTITVPIAVPGTLTGWRVLGLGQTAAGAQAGAVTTFSTSLPAYVDLAVPTFLYAGDQVRLPVQAVNQEGAPLEARLDVSVAGGSGSGGGALKVPAFGSRTQLVDVGAPHAGTLTVTARLGSLDTVERVIPVRPVGRPIDQVRGGTLAGPRSFALAAPPGGTDGSLVVTVFPGALGVARAELESAALRGDTLPDAAYAYALAGLADPAGPPVGGVGAGVGERTALADFVRGTQLRAWQRIAKHTRAPSVPDATTALLSLRLAPADTLAGRLAVRLAEELRSAQAPDGLWTSSSGAQLDATLVQTARAVWALGADNKANRLRATGAFERYRARLSSPYVAAWALTANVIEPGTAELLRATVRGALHLGADGAKTLRVTATRPDGARVTEAEATALAILAFPKDDPAASDLAAGLLGLYRPGVGFGDGFGDGEAGLIALHALESVFHGEIPKNVTITVTVDGAVAGSAVLDPTEPHAPVRVVAPGLSGFGEHAIAVNATPAVPGLAFTAVSRAWVPWAPAVPGSGGLDLVVSPPPFLLVGRRADVGVVVAAPADLPVDVSIGLPAGVAPDIAALDALVSAGRIGRWKAEDGRVTLSGLRTEGGAWAGTVPVTASLAGALLADVSRVYRTADPETAFVRMPERWTVR